MDFYEDLVHFYLTDTKQLTVLPQAATRFDLTGKSWLAEVDFMGLDFIEKNIYLVEVSKSSAYLAKVVERLAEENYRIIESYVKKEILKNELSSFRIGMVVVC